MIPYVSGSGARRPEPRLPGRAEHALDVDPWRNWHWLAPPPSDSHRQVLAMYQEQPGKQTNKQIVMILLIFFSY